MKHVMFAVPLALLLGTTAIAQTDTTTGATTGADATTGASGEMFGTNWPLSVGTTFFSDAESATLRSSEELSSGWQSLSAEDQTMIRADCQTFMAAHGDASTGASTDTSTSTTTTGTAGTDAAPGTDTTATGTASTDTGAAEVLKSNFVHGVKRMPCRFAL